ncbi:MAG TPA: iron-containing alcohol dehydrogenase [Thermoleophilia bacterium]|nr:iron-containing alcohol dehydrogenase [Thermoleophilia bacterium]
MAAADAATVVTVAEVALASPDETFSWRDDERLVRFGRGAAGELAALLQDEGLVPLLALAGRSGSDALARLTGANGVAAPIVHVPTGPVPDAAAAVEREFDRQRSSGPAALVALGGGRVIDVSKTLAAAYGLEVVAVPTTLSGAEMSAGHRPMADGRGGRPLRPRLVVNDPSLSASLPLPGLAASAMNALGHAVEAFYGPRADQAATVAARRAAGLIASGLGRVAAEPAASRGRDELALGALLAGYAIARAGLGLHHVVCQTVVRMTGASHAQVNAVLLPHTTRFMLAREPDRLRPLVVTLVDRDEPDAAADGLARLAALSGAARLGQLGVTDAELPGIAHAALERPELQRLTPPVTAGDLLALLKAAA